MFNNDHTLYSHMDATWSVELAWTYFTHPDYLVVQHWGPCHFSFPDTFNQTGPHVYHYVNFFLGRVSYKPLGTLCDCTVAIIDHSHAAMPFAITNFQPSKLSSLTSGTMLQNCQVLVQYPWAKCMHVMSSYLIILYQKNLCMCVFFLLILFSLSTYWAWACSLLW